MLPPPGMWDPASYAPAKRRLDARLRGVEPNRDLASWLVGNRPEIEKLMTSRLGPAAPKAAAPETEALRRFRSFSASALLRGKIGSPALDGLRPNERRVMALLSAWTDAARTESPRPQDWGKPSL